MRRIQRYVLIVSAAVLLMLGRVTTLHAQSSDASQGSTSASQNGPSPASPKSGEKEGSEADPTKNSPAIRGLARMTGMSPERTYWLSVGLNFALVLIIIVVLARKNLPPALRGRSASIQKRIEEARTATQEARSRLTEVEGRLSRLDSEIAQMRREAEENARAEEQRLLTSGEEERRRIVTASEQEISMAASTARRELKTYAAELAVDLAEKKIRIAKDIDQGLVREFTSRLGKDGN